MNAVITWFKYTNGIVVFKGAIQYGTRIVFQPIFDVFVLNFKHIFHDAVFGVVVVPFERFGFKVRFLKLGFKIGFVDILQNRIDDFNTVVIVYTFVVMIANVIIIVFKQRKISGGAFIAF